MCDVRLVFVVSALGVWAPIDGRLHKTNTLLGSAWEKCGLTCDDRRPTTTTIDDWWQTRGKSVYANRSAVHTSIVNRITIGSEIIDDSVILANMNPIKSHTVRSIQNKLHILFWEDCIRQFVVDKHALAQPFKHTGAHEHAHTRPHPLVPSNWEKIILYTTR